MTNNCWYRHCYFWKSIFVTSALLNHNHAIVVNAQKIAVIGGGLSGTFTTKYLVDNDPECKMDSITIYDPWELGQIVTTETSPDTDWQGSRISPLKLPDGRIVELGASIGYDGFRFVLEMIRNDPSLTAGRPFNTGKDDQGQDSQASEEEEEEEKISSSDGEPKKSKGMGLYNGNGDFAVYTAGQPKWKTTLLFLWRYNWDLITMSSATTKVIESFNVLQDLLNATFSSTIHNHQEFITSHLESPKSLWGFVGLYSLVQVSLEEACKALGVGSWLTSWRHYLLPYQGSLQDELLSAINLVNYNQNPKQINGISGMGSFAATDEGTLFSVVGGNSQIITSAFKQAQQNRMIYCPKPNTDNSVIQHVPQRIGTVVGSHNEKFEVFNDKHELLDEYDIVIVAAPLQQTKIEFLVKSQFDPTVLQPMPLNEVTNNNDNDNNNDIDHPGDHLETATFSSTTHLPAINKRPFTQVVTTVVQYGSLQADYFSIDKQEQQEQQQPLPRAVLMTQKGKDAEYNITAISQLDVDLHKIFSSQPLPLNIVQRLLGPNAQVLYEKIWGGPFGGATPDHQGQGETANFILYRSIESSPLPYTMYFPNAMEGTFCCMELSAMGAKAVAKLVARDYHWQSMNKNGDSLKEEL